MTATLPQGVYNLSSYSKVYCFSDLEGDIPVVPPFAPENVRRVLEILDNKRDLSPEEAIIYTGDLIDRGPKSIRLMQRMLQLKYTFPEKVILIGGNRDFNKIRMIDEFFIEYTDTNEPLFPLKNGLETANTIHELAKIVQEKMESKQLQFRFNVDQLSPPLKDTNEVGWQGIQKGEEFPFVFSADLKTRVEKVYAKTLGASQMVERCFVEEICEMCGDEAIKVQLEQYKYGLIALLNMAMGFKWNNDIIPTALGTFNGLYIDYIEKCHFIAAFKGPQNSYGFASHSGLPVFEDKFTLVAPLGSTGSLESDEIRILDVVQSIESEKQITLKRIKQSKFATPIRRGCDVIKMIRMSAGVGEVGDLHSDLSPAATMKSLKDKGPKAHAEKKRIFGMNNSNLGISGGAKAQLNNFVEGAMYFNIFGHQPAGYTPEVSKVDNVYHVCMDVSKAEFVYGKPDYANKYSMAVMTLGEKNIQGVFKKSKGNDDRDTYTYSKSIDMFASEIHGIFVESHSNNVPTVSTTMKASYNPKTFVKTLEISNSPMPQSGGSRKATTSFANMDLKSLKALAKERGIKGVSKMTKDDLVQALRAQRSTKRK